MKSGSAPDWARQLVITVCADAGSPPPAVLRWRRSPRAASTGLANRPRGSIAVTAGSDADDARHTLLHELAHWLTRDPPRRPAHGRRRAEHHGAAFYATALGLYARHAGDMAASLRREAARYPSALRYASAAGIVEAAVVADERRRARAVARAGRTWRLLVAEHRVTLVREGRWYVCATCRHRLVGRVLRRALRRGSRERHALWTREVPASASPAGAG